MSLLIKLSITWDPAQTTCLPTQTKVDSVQECVCVRADECLFLCVSARRIARVWWRHVLASHYALAQKVLPDHANTTAPGGSARREEMSGREWNVCVHYAYEPLPHFFFRRLHTPKSFNSGDAADAYMSWVNLYHVCHRKIKARVYSGALLSLLISISKRRRWHGRVLSHPSRPEQTGPDWTKGIIAGMWLHSTG